MSYTPTEWETGQTITAEKLNKLEQGVAGAGSGIFWATVTYDEETETYKLDKSYNEIKAALQAGRIALVRGDYSDDAYDDFITIDYIRKYSKTSSGMCEIFMQNDAEGRYQSATADGVLTYALYNSDGES